MFRRPPRKPYRPVLRRVSGRLRRAIGGDRRSPSCSADDSSRNGVPAGALEQLSPPCSWAALPAVAIRSHLSWFDGIVSLNFHPAPRKPVGVLLREVAIELLNLKHQVGIKASELDSGGTKA